MRIGLFGTMMALLVGMGPVLAQPPAPTQPVPAAPAGVVPTDATVIEPGSPIAPGPLVVADNRYYGSFEYLLWRIKDGPIPPLQFTGPYTQTSLDDLQSTLTVGGVGVEYAGRSGGRLTLGYWAIPERELAIEGSYFEMERRNDAFVSNQVANLPLNVTINQVVVTQSISNGVLVVTQEIVPQIVTLPAQINITSNGSAGPSQFWGSEINARSTRAYFGSSAWDFLAGARFLDLDENFAFTETITLQAANPNTLFTGGLITNNAQIPTVPPPIVNLRNIFTTITTSTISTRNRFYGAQVGSAFEWWLTPRLSFNGWGKFAAGAMVQTVNITGFTSTTTGAGAAAAGPGGILAPLVGFQEQGHTRYAVIPEFMINLGYQLTPNLRTTIGYNFLYVTSVVRPGDQITFNSTSTQFNIAGTASTINATQPSLNYQNNDFWAQGLTAGVELRY